MTRMVAAQYAPAPSRRKRGGLPAGCSAIVLVCLLALTPGAQGASGPAPDPVPNVQPDAAPVPTTHTKSPTVQQPSPATTTQPETRQPAPVRQQTTPAASTVVAPRPRPAAHRAAKPAAKHRSARRHKTHAQHPARTARVITYRPDTATPAVRRVARLLAFEGLRARARRPVSDRELAAAAAALLLLVAASASVLRLSTRIAGGRLG